MRLVYWFLIVDSKPKYFDPQAPPLLRRGVQGGEVLFKTHTYSQLKVHLRLFSLLLWYLSGQFL
jgi:hypothetical protein